MMSMDAHIKTSKPRMCLAVRNRNRHMPASLNSCIQLARNIARLVLPAGANITTIELALCFVFVSTSQQSVCDVLVLVLGPRLPNSSTTNLLRVVCLAVFGPDCTRFHLTHHHKSSPLAMRRVAGKHNLSNSLSLSLAL